MNWQTLGPMIHRAAKQHLQNPTRQNELELLLCIQAGDKAGSHTEWDSRATGPEDEFGFVPEPPDTARDV